MKFNCGLYISKVQPLHIAHIKVINNMLNNCGTVVIAIENDPKSIYPWAIEDRIEMIERIFDSVIIKVIPIPALSITDKWRTQFLKITDICKNYLYPYDPDVIYTVTKEQTQCYTNFAHVEELLQDITDAFIQKEIKNNRAIDHLVPSQILPIIYRSLDMKKL